MSDKIVDILSELNVELCKMQDINKQAMIFCQGINMQGFKRLHRCDAKKMFSKELCLENYSIDLFSKPLKAASYQKVVYSPGTLKIHMEGYIDKLKEVISKIGFLNKEYFANTGCLLEIGQCVQALLVKRLCKFNRWYKRFTDVNWLMHDVYVVDKWLHDKVREEEEEAEVDKVEE